MDDQLPDQTPAARRRSSRKTPAGVKFSELPVGAYYFFGLTRDMGRVYRKCGSRAAIKPEGGACRVAHNQVTTPLTDAELAQHLGGKP